MKLLAVVGEEIHEMALRQARELGRSEPLPVGVLHAPLDDEAQDWIDRIWDTVEGAVRTAYREGIEAARPLIERVTEQLGDLARDFARRADEVRAAVVEKLNAYLQAAIDAALARLRPIIAIGESRFQMSAISVEQKINLSGSLKASLEEVCSFVAAGELSITASYGSPGVGSPK